ncbi:MAG: hypothetical protein QM765_17530 [Myxococcales bacterium]
MRLLSKAGAGGGVAEATGGGVPKAAVRLLSNGDGVRLGAGLGRPPKTAVVLEPKGEGSTLGTGIDSGFAPAGTKGLGVGSKYGSAGLANGSFEPGPGCWAISPSAGVIVADGGAGVIPASFELT